MTDRTSAARAALRNIRHSRGYAALRPHERAQLDTDLGRIDVALGGSRPSRWYGPNYGATSDPFAVGLETPADLAAGPGAAPRAGPRPPARPPVAAPRRGRAPAGTEVLGERARNALEAVDFPSFVAELIQGTFQAIVDATAQQVREYAKLVADISKSVDDFTRDNVTDNQARDHLVDKHSQDLMLLLPRPGEETSPAVLPRDDADESPPWLETYGLGGQELTPELVEGPLLNAGKLALGEDRLRTLATMVLMGINRIVVDDGQLRARLQFHARAREKVSAEVVAKTVGQQVGIAARSSSMRSAVSTMVSTVDVNTQADVSIKADLVGEVMVRFRTQAFDINQFVTEEGLGLITRHSLTRNAATEEPTAGPPPPTRTPEGGDGS